MEKVGKRIVKNIVAYLSANVISKLLLFLFNIFVARFYGTDIFGIFNYSVTIVSYFIMFANFGIQNFACLNISRNLGNYESIFNDVVSSQLFLGIISSFGLICYTLIVPEHQIMVLCVGTTIILDALNISWLFTALQKMKYVAIQIFVNSLLSMVLLFVIIMMNMREMYYLPILVSISLFLSYLYYWYVAYTKLGIRYQFTLKKFKYNVRHGLPFLFSGIFSAINCTIDILILSALTSDHIVGVYCAIYKIINMILLLVGYVVQPAFPQLVKMYIEKRKENIQILLQKLWITLFIVIFPVVSGGLLLGENIILFLYGSEYSDSGFSFRVLLAYTFVFFCREIYSYLLTMTNHQPIYMVIMFISCVCNILLNILLIPKIGMDGAAITTFVCELVNYILMKYMATRYYSVKLHFRLSKIIMSTIIMSMFTFILFKQEVGVLLTILCSMIVYVVMFCVFKFNRLYE